MREIRFRALHVKDPAASAPDRERFLRFTRHTLHEDRAHRLVLSLRFCFKGLHLLGILILRDWRD